MVNWPDFGFGVLGSGQSLLSCPLNESHFCLLSQLMASDIFFSRTFTAKVVRQCSRGCEKAALIIRCPSHQVLHWTIPPDLFSGVKNPNGFRQKIYKTHIGKILSHLGQQFFHPLDTPFTKAQLPVGLTWYDIQKDVVGITVTGQLMTTKSPIRINP